MRDSSSTKEPKSQTGKPVERKKGKLQGETQHFGNVPVPFHIYFSKARRIEEWVLTH